MATQYKALTGLNVPDGNGGEIRVEAGETLPPGVPSKAIKTLLNEFKDADGNTVPQIEAIADDEPVAAPAGGE